MRSLLTILSITILGMTPLKAQLSEFTISVWPEYDHEGVLVIFNGRLEDGISLPHTLSFPLPSDVHQILSMGTGASPETTVQLEPESDHSVLLHAQHRAFQLEYYTHPFSGPVNTLDFNLTLPYNVSGNVEFYLQKPLAAANFSPGFQVDEVQHDRHNLEYHTRQLGPQTAGTPLSFPFSYENPAKTLSMDILRDMRSRMEGGSNPENASPSPSSNNSQKFPVWVWIGAVLVVATLAFLAVMMNPTPSTTPAPGQRKYCNSCGKPLSNPQAKFCNSCGHKLT